MVSLEILAAQDHQENLVSLEFLAGLALLAPSQTFSPS